MWLAAWVTGNVLGAAVLTVLGYPKVGVATPLWATAAGTLLLWTPMVAAVWWACRVYGGGSPVKVLGLAFAPVDLLGLAIGVFSQLVLLRVLYWPLERIWPAEFNQTQVEESARTLYDSAHGIWLVVLVLIVVVGAPFVEELLYRGLLQHAFVRRFGSALGVLIVAALFAIIHFRPIELPGLFAFGVVLGVCAVTTRRLGMGLLAHGAFNAEGLWTVAHR